MKDPRDEAARAAILARMAESRAEIKHLLEPRPEEAGGAAAHHEAQDGGFPRSRTMRALLSGRGLGAVGATAAGLLIARPAMVLRLIRLVPKGALMRLALIKATEALRSRRGAKR